MLRETILTSFNVTAMLRPHGGLNHLKQLIVSYHLGLLRDAMM
jgi:hypothetical protein